METTLPTIGETVDFIMSVHAGQVTKAGEPYWTHPVAVMALLPRDATNDERLAALLHDVIEDTPFDEQDLIDRGYSERVVSIVKALSRPEGENRSTYMDWIRRLAESRDQEVIRVKLADNMHNSDHARIAALPEAERGIVKRYKRSMRILRDALEPIGANRDGRSRQPGSRDAREDDRLL